MGVAGGEVEEPSKFEKKVAKVLHMKPEDVMMVFAVVLAIALSILLFFVLPTGLEALIKKLSAAPKQPKLPINRLYYDRLAQEIGDRLGRKAVLSPGKKGGKLTLEYYSDEDLNALAELLQKE